MNSPFVYWAFGKLIRSCSPLKDPRGNPWNIKSTQLQMMCQMLQKAGTNNWGCHVIRSGISSIVWSEFCMCKLIWTQIGKTCQGS